MAGLCGSDFSSLGNYTIVADIGHLPAAGVRYAGQQVFQADTQQLKLFDGTNWVIMSEPLQTYTPTLTNITLGTGGLNLGRYHRSDGWVDVEVNVVLGTGGSVNAGVPTIRLPIQADVSLGQWNFLTGLIFDNSAAQRYIAGSETAGLDMIVEYLNVVGSNVGSAPQITSTAPMTWAVNDQIRLAGRYRMLSRYS